MMGGGWRGRGRVGSGRRHRPGGVLVEDFWTTVHQFERDPPGGTEPWGKKRGNPNETGDDDDRMIVTVGFAPCFPTHSTWCKHLSILL